MFTEKYEERTSTSKLMFKTHTTISRQVLSLHAPHIPTPPKNKMTTPATMRTMAPEFSKLLTSYVWLPASPISVRTESLSLSISAIAPRMIAANPRIWKYQCNINGTVLIFILLIQRKFGVENYENSEDKIKLGENTAILPAPKWVKWQCMAVCVLYNKMITSYKEGR